MEPGSDRPTQPDLRSQVDQVLSAIKKIPTPYLVAVSGIPGSGKSTLCSAITNKIPGAVTLPMDGYHLTRKQLSDQDMKRRGAPHTFDYDLLREDLENLRINHAGSFPAFDHATKDPEPNAISINPDTSMVFVEGNYLMLKDWKLETLFDFTLFVDCDLKVAMDRVAQRLYQCGICPSHEEAVRQVQGNDLLNAQLILGDGIAERADLCL